MQDIVENYLLSLGMSIKNNYNFIPKRKYKYSVETETIEIGKVTLSKIYRDTKEFRLIRKIE